MLGSLVPLDCLQPGEFGSVADISGEPEWICRMAELGMQEGCHLKMVQNGSTCLLQIGECRLCLRADKSAQILVRLQG